MTFLILHQVQELHRKLSEETRRADNLAFDMKKFEEKHEALLKEKEVLTQTNPQFCFHILNMKSLPPQMFCGTHLIVCVCSTRESSLSETL